MNWLVIEGVKPWDGRYEFDLEGQEPTTREWGWIKRLSGYLPMTIQEGVEGADPELFCTFAVIALYRAGRIQPSEAPQLYERLADAPFGATITVESDPDPGQTEDGDAGPPAESSNGSSSSAGDGSRTSSESSEQQTPVPTGTPGSDASASGPSRWGN
jgi:hypothetical protein